MCENWTVGLTMDRHHRDGDEKEAFGDGISPPSRRGIYPLASLVSALENK